MEKRGIILILIFIIGILNLSHISAGLGGQGWAFKKNITIPYYKITEDLINFPLVVKIYDTDLSTLANNDGSDIVFAINDNQVLNYQIEYFNKSYNSTTSLLIAWIKVNLSISSDNVFWMYYNNSNSTNMENSTGVWSNGFKGVYHLSEDSGSVNDSTNNLHNSLSIGGTPDYDQPGKIGNAINFNSLSDENFNFGDVNDFNFNDNFSVSSWIKTTQSAASIGVIGKLNNGFQPYRGFALQTNSGNDAFWLNGQQSTGNITLNDDNWHYILLSRNSSGCYMFIDGLYKHKINNFTTITNTNSFYIGAWGYNMGGGYDYSGLIDEVQLSNAPRTNSWINASYMNQNNPLDFYNIGESQSLIDQSTSTTFSNIITSPVSGSLYNISIQYTFNVTINGTNGTTFLEFNNRNYSSSNKSNVFSSTVPWLSKGDYTYRWLTYSNDLSNNLTISNDQSYSVIYASSLVNLTINNSNSDLIINQGIAININCSLVNGEDKIYMYKDGVLMNSGFSKIGNLTNFSSNGLYNISCIYQSSENYSSNSMSYFVNVGNITYEPIYLNFLPTTPESGLITTNTSFGFFYEIITKNLTRSIWSFDLVNYTYFSNNLLFWMNFDNNSKIGEDYNHFTDISSRNNNGNCSANSCPNYTMYGGRFTEQNINNNNLIFMDRFNSDLSSWTVNQYGGSVSIVNKDYSNKLLLNDTSSASYVYVNHSFSEPVGKWILEFDLMYNTLSEGVMELLDSSDNVIATINTGEVANTISFFTDNSGTANATFNSGGYRQVILKVDNQLNTINAYYSESDGTQGSLDLIGIANYSGAEIKNIRFRTSTMGNGALYIDEVRMYIPGLALIGDSITDGKPRWSTHPGYPTGRLSISSDEISSPNFKIGNLLCSNCWIANRAFGGTTTSGVDSHIQDSVLDQEFKQVYIAIGHNDIMNGLSLATMQSNFNLILDKVYSAGISGQNIIIANVFPSGYLDDTQVMIDKRNQWNSWLRLKANEIGAIYVDLDSDLKDPNNNNSIRPGLSDDGTHLYPQGNDILANSVVSTIYSSYNDHSYGSLNFDGTNDLITCKNETTYISNELFISSWIRFFNNSNSKVLSKGNSFSIGILNNKIILKLKANGRNSTLITNKTYNDSNWHIINFNYNGSRLSLYVDGILDSYNLSAFGTIDTNNNNLIIGSNGSSEFFIGNIDEVRIYNKSFSISEIIQLNNMEFIKYNSTKYNFYIKEDNLTQKIYYYSGYSTNIFGFENIKDTRNLSVVYDIQPPSTITNLVNQYRTISSIYWSWQNPSDSDFYQNIIYLNGFNVINNSNNFYNATGLSSETSYNLSVITKDNLGNININSVSSLIYTLENPVTNSGSGGSSRGGGGGGGFYIKPKNKTFNEDKKIELSKISGIVARAGDKKSIALSVTNSGTVFLNKCKLYPKGEVSSWISTSDILGISPGENVNFNFFISVPDNTPAEDYVLELELKCDEMSESEKISLTVTGLSTIKIKEVKQETKGLKISYKYLNKKLIMNKTEVLIWIEDKEGVEVKRIKDIINPFKGTETNRDVIIHLDDSIAGVYTLYIAISDDPGNYVKQSVVLGNSLITGRAIEGPIGSYVFSYIFLIAIISLIIYFAIKGVVPRINKSLKAEKPKNEVKEVKKVKNNNDKNNRDKKFDESSEDYYLFD